MKILFHSDDAGISAGNTARILDCWERGQIDGFSLLANPETVGLIKNAVLVKCEKPLRLAVHLNLSDGRSVNPPSDLPLLVNGEGYLKTSFPRAFLIHILGGKRKRVFLEQVKEEWRAQLELIQSVIGKDRVMAVDGHNHIHMIPSLFNLAKDLALEYKIPTIRLSREVFYFSKHFWENLRPGFFINLIKHILLNILSSIQLKKSLPADIFGTERILGVLFSGKMTRGIVNAGLDKCREAGVRSVEVIFHLGKLEPAEAREWTKRKKAFNFYASSDRDLELETVRTINISKTWN